MTAKNNSLEILCATKNASILHAETHDNRNDDWSYRFYILVQSNNVPHSIHTRTVNVTSTGGSQVPTIQPPILTGNKDDFQHNISPAKGVNTTLKRIKP